MGNTNQVKLLVFYDICFGVTIDMQCSYTMKMVNDWGYYDSEVFFMRTEDRGSMFYATNIEC